MFDATWKQFRTKFERILNNMNQHKDLIEKKASLMEYEEARESRLKSEKLGEQQEDLRRKMQLQTWLAGANVCSGQERGQTARCNHPQSGRWLLLKAPLRAWFDPKCYTTPLLWIHGIPGSGKKSSSIPIFTSKELMYMRRKDSIGLHAHRRNGAPQEHKRSILLLSI